MGWRKELSFMNGVPELLILRHLADREMYGYELVAAIGRSTGGAISLGEGCVYPILHTMQENGLLSCRRMTRDGRSRLYYRLTEKGNTRLGHVTANWQRVTAAVQAVLGATHAQPSGT